MRFVRSMCFEKLKTVALQLQPTSFLHVQKVKGYKEEIVNLAQRICACADEQWRKGDYCIMNSLVLVILGSGVLKSGLWFAKNMLYSVIPTGSKESLGNLITALSSNTLALFASHTQERLPM